ncbi:MAG: TIGR02281 family clan AA aspartic protease [Hyphomicrobium sp.]|uniref:retropepsin-like aspartic protease family protein n=1 Tax=Hyphomicrobium sp. TaxID=82 RepID=UPI0039E3B8CB
MLFLLFIIIIGLAGVVGATLFGGMNLDAVPNLPVAASVIGILLALYLATLLSHRGERRLALWPTIAACVSGVILVTGAFNKNASFALSQFVAFAKPADEALPVMRDASASVRLRRSDEGGFSANSEINGAAMTVRVDSGSATVVLKQSDAEKAGIDVGSLTYDTPLRTANGTSYMAPVRLKSVRIGPLVMDDVEGMVARTGTLHENLLGTSFLRRLTSYELAGNFATLRQ